MHSPKTKSGFSLVELSIVLVILGLLVGGILAGQSLIRAAEMRNVTTEYQKWQTAINSFRGRYQALPGDMPNATRFWGELHASASTCRTQSAEGQGTSTCNGNGDGTVWVDSNESFRFWQHLANAGLIEGQYTGVRGTGGPQHAVIGENVPASRVSGAGWSFDESGNPPNPHYWLREDIGNTMILGAPTSSYSTEEKIFRVEEIWSVDMKIDDGKPGAGVIQALPRDFPTLSRTQPETEEYPLSATGLGAISFVRLF